MNTKDFFDKAIKDFDEKKDEFDHAFCVGITKDKNVHLYSDDLEVKSFFLASSSLLMSCFDAVDREINKGKGAQELKSSFLRVIKDLIIKSESLEAEEAKPEDSE